MALVYLHYTQFGLFILLICLITCGSYPVTIHTFW